MAIRSSIKDIKSFSTTLQQRHGQTLDQHQSKRLSSTKSRKKIFGQILNKSYKIDIEPNNKKLLKKIDQLQYEIELLKQIVHKNQKERVHEKEKYNQIIECKDQQLNRYRYQINELSQQLTFKNREIQCLKLEILRIQRCNNLIKQNNRLKTQNPEFISTKQNNQTPLKQYQYKLNNKDQNYFVTPFSLNQNKQKKREKQLNLDDLRVRSISQGKKNY